MNFLHVYLSVMAVNTCDVSIVPGLDGGIHCLLLCLAKGSIIFIGQCHLALVGENHAEDGGLCELGEGPVLKCQQRLGWNDFWT